MISPAPKSETENTCHSMNTPVIAAMKPKNLKQSREALADALLAVKRKDSSDKSAKSESHSLEGLLSRKRLGVSAEGGATKPNKLTYSDYRSLAHILEGTPDSVEAALEALNFDLHDIDLDAVECGLVDCGIERCRCCDWWFECGELVCEEDDSKTGVCPDCR